VADLERKTLVLEVCALDRAPSRLDVTEVTAPGVKGVFVVLPGHAPLLSNLDIAPLSAVLPDGGTVNFALNGGVIQVMDDRVLVLSKTVEGEKDIDADRARRARERAEERIKKHEDGMDVYRAEVALKRALTRLRVVDKQV
jgi:F-type H+-transporting ATPase subunit epsilon